MMSPQEPPLPSSPLSAPSEKPGLDPFIEVILSRPSYRVGGSVVGTIRLVVNPQNNDTSISPQQVFSDSYVFVAGWCRLDPRWHRTSEYAKQLQHPAVHYNLQNQLVAQSNVVVDEHCVCFWTTNVVQLHQLQERTIGKWQDVRPKPIGSTSSTATTPPPICLEQQQCTFTFRANLPLHLPPSTHANSCRYFYAAVVGTRVKLSPRARRQWMRHSTPIPVLSLQPHQSPPLSTTNTPTVYPLGICSAMAHSAGLPSHVSATELHQPTGQILVQKTTTRLQQVLQQPQTMRITDLQGIPCCVLTVLGVSTATPGSTLQLILDFPRRRTSATTTTATTWTPCYQVSASLEGEELVLLGHRVRAQAYPLDTAHARIDPESTERVCLSLQVPLNAPITLQTDLVRISVHCILDIAVANTTTSTTAAAASATNDNRTKPPSFTNLRLELPCRIVHPVSEYESLLEGSEQEEEDVYLKMPLDELILGRSYRSMGGDADRASEDPPLVETTALRNTQDATHPNSFVTNDIRQDLKVLSLRMAKECNLVQNNR